VLTHGPYWQTIRAGYSPFTWDASARYWVSNGRKDHVKNVDIDAITGLPNIANVIGKRRHALFGHVVRLDATTPAHQALKQVIATKAGHCQGTNWRRPPGLPRKTWIQQIGDGTPASWRQMWQSAEERGYRGESSQRTIAVYAL